ncbi:Transcription factor LUX [Cardamine amara subsp. amara]|uniref:Transcription factor LUX n=1 Tax=Cardamine amara subsp. amara TaxID=228776 RepID=A0ABD1AUF2_CARAN
MSDYDVSGDEDSASLSYSLIPPNLAMAFNITPERSRTIQEVNRASETTLSSLRSGSSGPNTCSSNNNSNSFKTGVAVEEEDRAVLDQIRRSKTHQTAMEMSVAVQIPLRIQRWRRRNEIQELKIHQGRQCGHTTATQEINS